QPTPAVRCSGNDVDSVDVGPRPEWPWFDSSIRPNVAGNFAEHTRTRLPSATRAPVGAPLRLTDGGLRPAHQAVEYFAEWSLVPDNCAFQRIHTGLTGSDRHRRQAQLAAPAVLRVAGQPAREPALLSYCYEPPNGDPPTDESGCSDSEPASSGAQPLPASTSYASLTDFVSEIISSDIVGDPNQLRQSRSAARLVIDGPPRTPSSRPTRCSCRPRLPVELAAKIPPAITAQGGHRADRLGEALCCYGNVSAADGVTPVTAWEERRARPRGPAAHHRRQAAAVPRRVGSVGSPPGHSRGGRRRVLGPASGSDRRTPPASAAELYSTSTPASARSSSSSSRRIAKKRAEAWLNALARLSPVLSHNLDSKLGSAIGELVGLVDSSSATAGAAVPIAREYPPAPLAAAAAAESHYSIGSQRSVVESSALIAKRQEVVKRQRSSSSGGRAGSRWLLQWLPICGAAAAAFRYWRVFPGAKKGPDTSAADQAFLKDMR
uniref:BHLH domain-containing protein n=1 Tax=Macrostomum lignano TaxID=282301 RepID=A0A1I8F4Z3_9PLAT